MASRYENQKDRFHRYLGDMYHCIICTNVFVDPVMCGPNEHIFCRACITKHLMNFQRCPSCNVPLTVDLLSKPPSVVVKLLFDVERGCDSFVAFKDLCYDVVVAGGKNTNGKLNSVETFNLSKNTWTRLDRIMTECRIGASSVISNAELYVLGGYVKSMEKLSLDAVRKYKWQDLITWENVTLESPWENELPEPLEGHCTVVHNARLIVIGGHDTSKPACSDRIIKMPPVQLLATMPQARSRHSVAMFGDKILIVGGREITVLSNTALRNVVTYDIIKNEFQELAPLPYPVSEMATVKWGDDNVIIMGGADSDDKPLNKVLVYNIKTQKSHILPDMKYKRKGCVAAVVRDTVIVMGGQDESGDFLKSVEKFTFDSYIWDKLQDMDEARYRATAAVC